jgi:hypothetical protein
LKAVLCGECLVGDGTRADEEDEEDEEAWEEGDW